jgi:hypothetical protein
MVPRENEGGRVASDAGRIAARVVGHKQVDRDLTRESALRYPGAAVDHGAIKGDTGSDVRSAKRYSVVGGGTVGQPGGKPWGAGQGRGGHAQRRKNCDAACGSLEFDHDSPWGRRFGCWLVRATRVDHRSAVKRSSTGVHRPLTRSTRADAHKADDAAARGQVGRAAFGSMGEPCRCGRAAHC